MKNVLFCVFLLSMIVMGLARDNYALEVGGLMIDEGNTIIPIESGGYVVAGNTYRLGLRTYSLYIAKFNSAGSLIWFRTLGYADLNHCYSVIQTIDGGFAMIGSSHNSTTDDSDILLVKLDSMGSLEWARTIGYSESDVGSSIIQTDDGGYAIGGWTESLDLRRGQEYLYVKLDMTGSFEWATIVGERRDDICLSAAKASDGGYILAGSTSNYGVVWDQILLVKLDESGSFEWAKTIRNSDWDYCNSIVQTSDGGYAIGGHTENITGEYRIMFLAKLDDSCNIEWARNIEGYSRDEGQMIYQTSDEKYLLAGWTESFGAVGRDLILTKFNTSGDLEWAEIAGDIYADYGYAVTQTTDNYYIATGSIAYGYDSYDSDIFIVKFDSSGASCIGRKVEPRIEERSPIVTEVTPLVASVTPTVLPISLLVSYASPNYNEICRESIAESTSRPKELFLQLKPNPFNSSVTIELSDNGYSPFCQAGDISINIFDINGRKVHTIDDTESQQERLLTKKNLDRFTWTPAPEIPSGIYIVQAIDGYGQTIKKRVIFLR